ncbi:MAG: hypothetical protein LLG14_03825 [Nocardiaceae bacterium]|nr:hypothetical protein [Nocardiaceae bacterium]
MHITARHTAKTLITLALASGGLALFPGTASAEFCYASSGNNFVGPRDVSVGTNNACVVGDGTNNRALAVGSGNTATAGTNVDSPDATADNNTATSFGNRNIAIAGNSIGSTNSTANNNFASAIGDDNAVIVGVTVGGDNIDASNNSARVFGPFH